MHSAPRVRLLSTALLIDALGTGIFGPFVLLYGHTVAGLPLADAGLALTIAGGAGLAFGPIAGGLVDRIGPAPVAITSNLVAAAGGVSLLFVHDPVSYALAAFLGIAAARGFWAAFASLVAENVTPERRDRLFGWLQAVRFTGLTAGAGLASLALQLGTRTGLRLLVAADAASYLLAALLVLAAYALRSPGLAPLLRPREVAGTAHPAVPPTTAGPLPPAGVEAALLPATVDGSPRAEAALTRATVDRSLSPAALAGAAPQTSGGGPVPRPGGYRVVLADRDNLRLFALNIACTLSCTLPGMTMPVYVLERLHQPSWLPGLLAGVIAAALTGCSLVAVRLAHGRNRLTLLATANLIWTVAALVLAGAAVVPGYAIAVLVLGAALLGIAQGVYSPTADALPLAIAPPGLAGRYTAVHQFAWGVSQTVAPLLAAVLLDRGSSPVWLVLATLTLLTAAGYARLRPRLGVRVGAVGDVPATAVAVEFADGLPGQPR
jgi:MFS family permease